MMSSPYKASAVVSTAGLLAYNVLTDEEFANLQILIGLIPSINEMAAGFPPKLIEPVAASGEILFTEEGDCVMSWGGTYVT